MPGQYEFTVTTDGKSHVSTYCVTPDDAKAVNADTKAGREYAEKSAKGACAITDYEAKGDKVSFSMACGEGARSSVATYHGDTFEADTTYTFMVNGKRNVRVSHLTAKRLGACK
ncbi:MAG TPA: DUF3617 family protein [Thermoanaerobaculia bacterium]